MIMPSPTEARRFGLSFGRAAPTGAIDTDRFARACEQFDVVVVRRPASAVSVPAELARIPGYVTLCADHLCSWERTTSSPIEGAPADGWRLDTEIRLDEVETVIRDSFAGYRNHYRANPLLDPADIADGYVEWAQHLAIGSQASIVLRDPAGVAAGLALIDWDVATPDIRLAGMRSSGQGHGHYRLLLAEMIRHAADRGHERVQISTQSHNTKVMRAWTRVGFVPVGTIATYHLIRAELLA